MHRFILMTAILMISACSQWPKVNLLGNDFYLSPFPSGELDLDIKDIHTGGSASSDASAPAIPQK